MKEDGKFDLLISHSSQNPIPPSPWTNVLDCTNFTIACAQLAHGLDVPNNRSEDCLYLELWTPPPGKYHEPAAVMLFFHGGDFSFVYTITSHG